MAIYYFKTGTGEPFTDKTDAGDDAVARGHAIKVSDAPEGIESWRMSYNFGTSKVDVKFEGQSNDDAVDSYKAEKDAQTAAEATQYKQDVKDRDAADA